MEKLQPDRGLFMPAAITVEEFAAMPQSLDGWKEELHRGEVIRTPIAKCLHGGVQATSGFLLLGAVRPRKLGWVTIGSGVVIERNPDSVFGPDVFFCSNKHHPVRPDGWLDSPPDLVVEVLSPDDAWTCEKIEVYVKNGVKLVWLVDPEVRTVTVYAGSLRGTELDESETITGGDVLPEFQLHGGRFASRVSCRHGRQERPRRIWATSSASSSPRAGWGRKNDRIKLESRLGQEAAGPQPSLRTPA